MVSCVHQRLLFCFVDDGFLKVRRKVLDEDVVAGGVPASDDTSVDPSVAAFAMGSFHGAANSPTAPSSSR